jgi:DNA-binding transcriptional regulator YhcF (GntR family)
MEGYIKLHRKMLENAIFYKPDYYQVWCYILLKVSHKDTSFIWNNQRKDMKKGSAIFSQKEMADTFKVSISKINRILNYLKTENQIEVKTSNKYTEIQVVRWEEYQESLENGNQTETKRKTTRKPAETIKNDKNIYRANVLLLEAEFNKLVELHGLDFTNKCLDELGDYKARSGKTYKEDYLAILKWVIGKVQKENPKLIVQKPTNNLWGELRQDSGQRS